MSSLTSALRIATTGMNVNQVGLGTVSHNIVNANTEGFTRQTLQMGQVAYNGFGAGADLQSINRNVDQFLVYRSFALESDLSANSMRRLYLDSMEGSIANATGQGSLTSLLGKFFSSASQVANAPGDSSLKRNMIQQAQLLTETMNSVSSSLESLQTRIDNDLTSELDTLNTTLRKIYELNVQIATAEAGTANGANANDLRDERDRQVALLAKDFKLQITNNTSTGGYRITTETGRRLVDESSYVQFERTSNPGGFAGIGFRSVTATGALSSTLDILDTAGLSSGKLKALVDARDVLVPQELAQLDNFASTFMTAFNKISSQGSSFPPVRTLTSGNTLNLANTAADLYANLDATLAGATLHISVVDANGNPVTTTAGNSLIVPAVAPTPITLPAGGPFSLDDLVTLINNDPVIGNTALGGSAGVTASTVLDAQGRPYLQIQSADSTLKVVLSGGGTGDVLGSLGMNNFFTGTGSGDIAIRPDILSNPALVPTGQMRMTDGGLSSLNNQTALAMSQLADTKLSFTAAGGLSSLNVTLGGYTNAITSDLALKLQDANSRESFSSALLVQAKEQQSNASGVNLNEELGLMLVYQQGFQASARIINVVNEMLQELVNVVR